MKPILVIIISAINTFCFTSTHTNQPKDYHTALAPLDTSYCPEFQDIYDYAVSQGFMLPSWQQRRVLDTLARNAVANGWWSKHDILYLFANNTGDLDFSMINWVDPDSHYAHDSLVTYVQDSGFYTGNSLNAHVNTNFTPNIEGIKYVDTNASTSVYILDDAPISGKIAFGTVDNTTARLFFRAYTSPGKYEAQINGSSTPINGGTSTGSSGFFTLNRSTNDTLTLYKNGSTVYAVKNTAGDVPSSVVYVGACKNLGNVLGSTENTFGFFSMGESLSESQSQQIHSDVEHAIARLRIVGGTPVPSPPDTLYSPEFDSIYKYGINEGFTLPSWQQRRVLDTLTRNLLYYDIWDSLDHLNVYASNAGMMWAKINWINPDSNYAFDQSLIFVTDSGFRSNGSSTAHMNTKYDPSEDAEKYVSGHAFVAIHIMDDRASGGSVDFGNIDNSNGRLFFRAFQSPDDYEGQINGSGTPVNGVSTGSKGFYALSRNGSQLDLWKDGNKIYSPTGSVGMVPQGDLYVGAAKNGANALGSTNNTYSFFCAGASLSDSQQFLLDSIVTHAIERIAIVGGNPVVPPTPPIFPSPYFMSDSNLRSTSYDWKGSEYDTSTTDPSTGTKFTLQYLSSALSIADFIINDTIYEGKVPNPINKGWQIDIPSGRDGWPFPLHAYYWFNNKTAPLNRIWYYRNTNLDSGVYYEKWIQFFGIRDSSDFGDPVDLTGKIYTTPDDSWLKIPSKDSTSNFMAILLVRNKLDRNGLYGSIRHDSRINFILEMKDSILGPKVPEYPEITLSSKSFGEIASINGFRTDAEIGLHDDDFSVYDSMFTSHNGYRIFDDIENYYGQEDSGLFAINPCLYFSGGMFDTDSTDENGLEIFSIGQYEAYMVTTNLKGAYNAGARDIIVCFQMSNGSKHYLGTDEEVRGNGGYYNWNGSSIHSDKHFLIGNDTVADWNSITRSKGIVDFDFTSNYDYRKSWVQGFINPDYAIPSWDINRTSRPSWLLSSSMFHDTMIAKRDSRIWPKISITANNKIFNPTSRDSVYSSGESYRFYGEFAYCFTGFVGNGNVDSTDLQDFMLPRQKWELNQNLDVILAFGNEEDRFWDNGQGRMPPRLAGMLFNVVYDGLCGTVKDRFGGHKVGARAADTSSNGIRVGIPSSYLGDGNWVQLSLMWMQYYRDSAYIYQQTAQGRTYPKHPQTGAFLERKPQRIYCEVHDYPGKRDQTTKVKPQYARDVNNYMAIPPEAIGYDSLIGDFVRWYRYNYPDGELGLSEVGYGVNSGATFSINREDIGAINLGDSMIRKTGTDTSYYTMYIPKQGYGIRQIGEILMWRLMMIGSPYFDNIYRYESRDYATPAISGGNLEYFNTDSMSWKSLKSNTDTTWISQSGFENSSKFNHMAFLIRNYRTHGGTPVWMNIAEVMNDWVLVDKVREDSIYQFRYQNITDGTLYQDVVWLPLISTDSITTSINLLEDITDVVKIDVSNGSYTPAIIDIPDSSTREDVWTIKPVVIRYKEL